MMQAKHGQFRKALARQGLFLLLNILLDAFPHVLRDLQGIAQRIKVAPLHKVIDIDSRAAQEIEFKRLLFIFNALGQSLRVKRLFDGLRHQRPALCFDARLAQLLFNCRALLVVDMSVALRGEFF